MLGPIDATIRALLLASARTTTQLRATEATHRAELREPDDVAGEGFVGGRVAVLADATARGAVRGTARGTMLRGAACGGACGGACGETRGDASGSADGSLDGTTTTSETAPVVSGGVALSRPMLPALAVVVRDSEVSAIADIESGASAVFIALSPAVVDPSSRTIHAPNASATSAATPTPFQTYGARGE